MHKNTGSLLKIAIAGINGRMGGALSSIINNDPRFEFVGGFDRSVKNSVDFVERSLVVDSADVILDFTTGCAAADLATLCAENGGPALVIGATGFSSEDLSKIDVAANVIPIVRAGNFSIGLNMLVSLVKQVSRAFPAESWDIEIVEAHHRYKVDAPSGAALMLGEAAALGRNVQHNSVECRGRTGITGERPIGEIGYSSLRGGGIVGEHSAVFAAAEEVVTLSHSALDRSMFARGALTAALWIHGRAPGQYSMLDVLEVGDRDDGI